MILKTLLCLALFLRHVCAMAVENGSLRTNAAYDPLDVDTTTPRLTWRLESPTRGDAQTAYQIQASTSSNFASADLWDSGKVHSANAFAIYDGKQLASRSAVYWRVKAWDVDNTASEWSSAAHFEVSLLSDDDWSASWITNDEFTTGETSLPMLAKEFTLSCDVSKARLYLLGLGLHFPEINGQEITDEVLQPGYSNINNTLPFSTYNVTEYVSKGDNVLGVILGKGIYDAEEPLLGRYRKFAQPYQQLRMMAQLEYECGNGDSGRVVSDENWLTTVEGPYHETSWYGGEEYDARKEITGWSSPEGDRSGWPKASLTTGPPGKLVSPRSPPLKAVTRIRPKSLEQNGDGLWVFDFGFNFVGTFAFTINQERLEGTRITFWPDENPDLGQESTGSPIFDAYTLSSSRSQAYSPRFLYHGFQYLGINTTWEPSLHDLEGLVIRAANEPVLDTSTSSELFNSIHEIIDRSIQGNMYSVLTDCPHREKFGWLEQDHLVFEPVALGYDIQAYGDDLVRTMADAQAEDTPGLITDIAPEYGEPMGGGYRNDPNWGRAIINVPYQLYHYYGDVNVLKMRHEYMTEYLEYLRGRAGNNSCLNDGGLGDWLALDTTTPQGAASTFAYHQATQYLSNVETILGNHDAAAKYSKMAEDIINGFNSMWLNLTGSPHYCATNTQACQAFALDMGAVPEKHKESVLSNLVQLIQDNDGLITVGEIALPSLFRVLRSANRDDLLYNWMNSKAVPSYGYMLEHGATSLWEHWDADETGGSLNHFMYGYGDLFLLQLSGLQQKSTSVAWREIIYDPVVQGNLTHTRTSYLTPTGTALAAWSKEDKAFTYSVKVPVGSKGFVHLNGTDLKEGGRDPKIGTNGVLDVKKEGQKTVVEIGSGTYEFSVTLP